MKMEILPQAEQATATSAPLMRRADNSKHIEIIKTFFLRGPNIWTYRPVLEAWLDIGDLEDFPSNTIPGFSERLCAWLPSLIEHRCGIGERGGFIQRLRDGTWPAHILEHVMIELQTLAGIQTGFGRARETSRRGVYKVAVRTPHETTGRAALHAARDLVMAAIEDRPYDVPDAVRALRAVAQDVSVGAGAGCIVDAAAERRLPMIRLNDGDLVQLGYGARQQRVWGGETSRTSAIAQGVAANRMLSRKLLQSCGLAVPEGRKVESAEDAWDAAQEFGMPVVVRPCDGDQGRGVSLRPGTREEIEAAYRLAFEVDSEVLVERFVSGHEYRLLVVGGRVVAAARRESVAASDVTDKLHPELAAAASLAARVVGLDIAGVDLIVEDISRPLNEQNGAIVGIEARPGLHMHNAAAKVGHAIVDLLFPGKEQGRIPVIGITGSSGKTLTAKLLAAILQLQGTRVGLACSDGLFLDQRQVGQGDNACWQSVQRILRNPTVEAAVIENGYRSILSEGLGYDRCQVGIVTGMDATDVAPEFDINNIEQMARVSRTQVDVVLPSGVAVLNAADAGVAALAPLCDGEVIFFASTPGIPALAEHRSRQGRAVFLQDGEMLFAAGEEVTSMWLAFEGRTSIERDSMLAAAAAAWSLGVPLALIQAGLESFLTTSGLPLAETTRFARPANTTAQSRKSVHGIITDQDIARPEPLEPAYGDSGCCDLLGA